MFMSGDDPEHGQGRADRLRQLVDADDREREAVHPDAEADRDRGGEHLAAELLPPAQAAEVVDRADRRRDGGAEQHPAHPAAERQERERRHDDAEEERQPAEARDRGPVALALLGAVDEAEMAGRRADGRRQEEDDDERRQRRVQRPPRWSVSSSQTMAPEYYFVP